MNEPNPPAGTIGSPDAPSRQPGEQQAPATLQATAAAAATDAGSLVDQAKEHLAGKAAAGKDGLADQLEGLADSVHRSGEQFAGKQDWLAHAIDGGAQELTSLAQALRRNDIASLFSQVQSFARRQPGLFVGASLAAGFAVARLGRVIAADLSHDDLPTMPEVGHGQR